MEESEVEVQENKKKEEKKQVSLVEVVKETETAFQTPDGQNLTRDGYLVWIGNKIQEIANAVA